MKRWFILLLCICLLVLAACGNSQSDGLTTQTKNPIVPTYTMTQEESAALTAFGLELLKNVPAEKENPLLSPASIAFALGMTANGAQGQTLEQMEAVLGLPVAQLNQALSGWKSVLPNQEDCSLHLANAIWLRNVQGLTVQDSFLQAASRWYDAEVNRAPFDQSTVDDINGWVNKNTKNMIPFIMKEIPEDTMFYLVNALAFEAKWATPYPEAKVRDWEFYPQEGGSVTVDMMLSTERQYLEDEQATGFVKYYTGRNCAFAALMPNEGITVEDYLADLTPEHLYSLLSLPQRKKVDAGLPAFELEFFTSLADTLRAMGMTDAFSQNADFSAMGQYNGQNLYISEVAHKTYIKVDPEGTKAAAVTGVAATPSSAPAPEEVKIVILERPFLYFLIDTQTNLPFFVGIFENPV